MSRQNPTLFVGNVVFGRLEALPCRVAKISWRPPHARKSPGGCTLVLIRSGMISWQVASSGELAECAAWVLLSNRMCNVERGFACCTQMSETEWGLQDLERDESGNMRGLLQV